MNKFLLQKTKVLLLKKFKVLPQLAIITGSGIKLFQKYKPSFQIKYKNIPFFSSSTSHLSSPKVKGHEGILKLFKIKKKNVLLFSGRKHLYEGLNILDVIANVRLAYELGIKQIIITNAAGGISKKLRVGDLMLITGFIDLMQATERGILSGITLPPFKIKSKFSSQLSALPPKARLAKGGSSQLNIKKGIYAGVLGPNYETYAEIKLLQLLGADAVGMSTVPELICAKSLGMDYAAISVISNVWNKSHNPSHNKILKIAKRTNKKLDGLILKIM